MIGAADWHVCPQRGEGLRIRQLLMSTMAAEEAMLATFASWLQPSTVFCSYNGRSYDAPLLKARYRGHSVDRARKLSITLGCVVMAPALLGAVLANQPLLAVLAIAAVLFGFQVAIGNIQTLPRAAAGWEHRCAEIGGGAGLAAVLGDPAADDVGADPRLQ